MGTDKEKMNILSLDETIVTFDENKTPTMIR